MERLKDEGPGSDGRTVSDMIRDRKDCKVKWPMTEVLREGSLEMATSSKDKAGNKNNHLDFRVYPWD